MANFFFIAKRNYPFQNIFFHTHDFHFSLRLTYLPSPLPLEAADHRNRFPDEIIVSAKPENREATPGYFFRFPPRLWYIHRKAWEVTGGKFERDDGRTNKFRETHVFSKKQRRTDGHAGTLENGAPGVTGCGTRINHRSNSNSNRERLRPTRARIQGFTHWQGTRFRVECRSSSAMRLKNRNLPAPAAREEIQRYRIPHAVLVRLHLERAPEARRCDQFFSGKMPQTVPIGGPGL